jgi:lysylphosphatidylglycerol synthetase-like protein (DUF2156 family)
MYKFTIRDLLWLTVVVALGVAWWVQWRQLDALRSETALQADNLAEAEKFAKRYGWSVEWNGKQTLFSKLVQLTPKNSAPAPTTPSD